MKTTELNTTVIKGNWHVLKGKLKQKYAQLTENDLAYVEGGEDELFGRLQLKLGKTKQEILDSLDKVSDKTTDGVRAAEKLGKNSLPEKKKETLAS